ncbi:MAG: MBL fold metallo-hydrolase [Akkermansiaceae bacterium]|nr:MBL fold metallo-hydrolase [Akkermansiaceae bacterium]MCF7733365.1 MBL fold metallo-hydrolase [Akkermansiaceae bacterium]
MRLTTYCGGICDTNGYLVETPDGNFLVDAPDGVTEWLAQRGTRVDHLLLTHQHFDHVLDAAALQDAGARLHALEDYSTDLTLESLFGGAGMSVAVPPYRIDRRLTVTDDPSLDLCGLSFTLYHIPGHSPDSIVFHLPALELAFSGDTLFAGSIGRTDLPRGGQQMLVDGIRRHLLTLPPQTKLLPGHGPATTVGREQQSNPYL